MYRQPVGTNAAAAAFAVPHQGKSAPLTVWDSNYRTQAHSPNRNRVDARGKNVALRAAAVFTRLQRPRIIAAPVCSRCRILLPVEP